MEIQAVLDERKGNEFLYLVFFVLFLDSYVLDPFVLFRGEDYLMVPYLLFYEAEEIFCCRFFLYFDILTLCEFFLLFGEQLDKRG